MTVSPIFLILGGCPHMSPTRNPYFYEKQSPGSQKSKYYLSKFGARIISTGVLHFTLEQAG